ncbi:MAG: ATP-dependent Clp protease proteolytic subunit [Planctomycetes bacterium]|nr:ATP-dependent Clp protease proteolytic subunit [Planctomycetota bacterium]
MRMLQVSRYANGRPVIGGVVLAAASGLVFWTAVFASDDTTVGNSLQTPPSTEADATDLGDVGLTDQKGAIITIDGTISDVTTDSIERRVAAARDQGVDVIIFEVDTPGGYVTSALDICDYIKNLEGVKTVAWINTQAYSAGSMISVACDEIVMARASVLGDCGVILAGPTGPQEVPEQIRAKAESPVLEQFRDSASKNGYDVLLCESMVIKEMEIYWVENSKTGERRFVNLEDKEELIEAETKSTTILGVEIPSLIDTKPEWKLVETYYDPINERFIVLILHIDFGNGVADIMLAVSDDSDPNGTWHKFRIDAVVPSGGTDYWADYPQVGLNQDAIAISGNMFGFAGGSNGAHVFVVKMEGLLNGTVADVTGFPMPAVFSLQPADNLGTNANPVIYGLVRETFSSMQIFAWENLTTTPTMVSTTTAIPTWSYASSGADTTGGRKLDNLPFHFMDSGFRDGKMVAAHVVALSPGDGRSTVDWYEFDVNSWPESASVTLAQSGKIELPIAEHAFMPAITKNALGDISVIYTRSSTSIGADIVISSRKVDDAPGTLSPPTLLKSSTGINFQPGIGRWGDYFSAVVDPVDDSTFWGVGEIIRRSLPSVNELLARLNGAP